MTVKRKRLAAAQQHYSESVDSKVRKLVKMCRDVNDENNRLVLHIEALRQVNQELKVKVAMLEARIATNVNDRRSAESISTDEQQSMRLDQETVELPLGDTRGFELATEGARSDRL